MLFGRIGTRIPEPAIHTEMSQVGFLREDGRADEGGGLENPYSRDDTALDARSAAIVRPRSRLVRRVTGSRCSGLMQARSRHK